MSAVYVEIQVEVSILINVRQHTSRWGKILEGQRHPAFVERMSMNAFSMYNSMTHVMNE
jgi:hypothetical protein